MGLFRINTVTEKVRYFGVLKRKQGIHSPDVYTIHRTESGEAVRPGVSEIGHKKQRPLQRVPCRRDEYESFDDAARRLREVQKIN